MLGLLGASKECRDVYISYFPIVLSCGHDCSGQLRIAKDEVLHIRNLTKMPESWSLTQAIGDSYLSDEWWSQLEHISFALENGEIWGLYGLLVLIITRMRSLKKLDLSFRAAIHDSTEMEGLRYQEYIKDYHNRAKSQTRAQLSDTSNYVSDGVSRDFSE